MCYICEIVYGIMLVVLIASFFFGFIIPLLIMAVYNSGGRELLPSPLLGAPATGRDD